MTTQKNSENLLEVSGLSVRYGSGRRAFTAVSDIALEIAPGETLGVVGESGSGKSTIGKAILGLEKAHTGSVRFLGRDITKHSLKQRKQSASELRVVFQDPYSSLNPDLTIGETLTEPLRIKGMGKDQAWAKAREVLGWQPAYCGLDGFRRGLQHTVSWFKDPGNLAMYKSDIYNL